MDQPDEYTDLFGLASSPLHVATHDHDLGLEETSPAFGKKRRLQLTQSLVGAASLLSDLGASDGLPPQPQRLKTLQQPEIVLVDFQAHTPPRQASASISDVWVQCELCSKWRKMPPGVTQESLGDVPWICQMNGDLTRNICEIEEEKEDEEEPVALRPLPPDFPISSPMAARILTIDTQSDKKRRKHKHKHKKKKKKGGKKKKKRDHAN